MAKTVKKLFFNKLYYVIATNATHAVELVGAYKNYPSPLSDLDYDELSGTGFEPLPGHQKLELRVLSNPDVERIARVSALLLEFPCGVLADLELS